MKAMEADYYNSVYERTDSISRSLTARVAEQAVGQSILDLGCGIGLLAALTECKYLGIDFSSVALDKAQRLHGRDGVEFLLADVYNLPLSAIFDTVVLQELLEHLDNPAFVVEKAYSLASQRVIVTVPKNIPDPAHVKPHWAEQDLRELLGDEARIESHGWYWIAVKDI